MMMNGMELSKSYYHTYGLELQDNFQKQTGIRAAAGLVGEGSQCFGYDDQYSRDHDWGPGFCLWLPEKDYLRFGAELLERYEALPETYLDYQTEIKTSEWKKRMGVWSIEKFYGQFLGKIPDTLTEWLLIPESYFAVAANGSVFEDSQGEFTRIREKLLSFYPEDVRIKKIVARAAVMAQAGQYNYPRCVNRRDAVATSLAAHEFLNAAISLFHLLKKRYTPFYKWSYTSLKQLDYPPDLYLLIEKIASGGYRGTNSQMAGTDCFEEIEAVCRFAVEELQKQGLTQSHEPFLQNHIPEMMEKIQSEEIKHRHILEG